MASFFEINEVELKRLFRTISDILEESGGLNKVKIKDEIDIGIDSNINYRLALIANYIQDILKVPDEYSGYGKITIRNLGDLFMKRVTAAVAEFPMGGYNHLSKILIFLARVAREQFIRTGLTGPGAHQRIIAYFSLKNEALTADEISDIELVYPVLANEVSSEKFLEKFQEIEQIQKKKETLQKFEASGLENLSEAFRTSIDKLDTSLTINFVLLTVLAFFCIVPIGFIFDVGLKQMTNMDALPIKVMEELVKNSDGAFDPVEVLKSMRTDQFYDLVSERINDQVNEKQIRDLWLYLNRTLTILPIEILLIYFFRLVHKNYRLVLSQRTQLMQRQTLSIFIHKWSEHKENFKEHDFNPFEKVVFSELISDITDTPNALDIDVISKLIPNIKSKYGP